MLADAYGRTITDLRVSVTQRCNFSCVYCHDEGLGPVKRPHEAHDEEMRPEEVERLVRVAREFGVRSVKFTGGEPLVRPDLEEIVRRTVREIPDVSLTTNGSFLEGRADSLREAGLKRVNVSVDTTDPERFRAIRRGPLAPVLRGVQAALRAGLTPVKLNLVVAGSTVGEVPGMIEYVGSTEGLKLQLIQFMPELAAHTTPGADIVSLRRWLEEHASRVLVREMHHRRVFRFGRTEVELVAPVDNPEFCANCHRLRVTHRGELKGCLNRNDDLVPTRGLDDDGVRAAFRQAVTGRVPYYGVYTAGLAGRRASAAPSAGVAGGGLLPMVP